MLETIRRCMFVAMFVLALLPREARADLAILRDGSVVVGSLVQRLDSLKVLLSREFVVVAQRDSGGQPSYATVKTEELRYIILQDSSGSVTYDVDSIRGQPRESGKATLAIGANLDLLNGISVTNAYYAFQLMLPGTFSSGAPFFVPSGFSLGLEQARQVGRDTTAVAIYPSDSLAAPRYVSGTLTSRTDVTTLSLGVYWPLLKVGERGTDLRVWFTVLGEFRRTRYAANYSSSGADSLGQPVAGVMDDRYAIGSYGICAIATLPEVTARVVVTAADYGPFIGFRPYMVQAEVRERRYGITVSGEVRGFWAAGYASRSGGEYPQFQVALSKTFGIDKLVEFLVKS